MGKGIQLKGVKASDEYYTRYEDIDAELGNYFDKLRGKSVYCPCDNPSQSKFWEYFHRNFSLIGLKSLTCTFYDEFCEETAFQATYTGGNDEAIDYYTIEPLELHGDFRSWECQEIMEKSDVIITNPPFTLCIDLVKQIMTFNKDYILIFPMMKVATASLEQLFVSGELNLGYNVMCKFIRPDGSTASPSSCCGWITSFPTKTTKDFNYSPYPFYDPTGKPAWYVDQRWQPYENQPDIREVTSTKDVPKDYYGTLGIPVTDLTLVNRDIYEILGASTVFTCEKLGFKRHTGDERQEICSQLGYYHFMPYLKDANGKYTEPFMRLFIKRKQGK